MLAAQSNIRTNVTNFNNTAYYGPMYFGTPKQGSKSSLFYYDTSSTYTTVTSANCSTCNTTYYNSNLSSTYVDLSEGNVQSLSYINPSVALTGAMAADTACIVSTLCATEFEFFVI